MTDNIERLNKELFFIEMKIKGMKELVEICKENNLAFASWYAEVFRDITELKHEYWRIKNEIELEKDMLCE